MTDKPKRPMSAYLLWLNSAREEIKAEHPGLKVTEIAKKAGELWRGMKDKSEWERKAAAAKVQYTKDLESYTDAVGEGGDGEPDPPAAKRKRSRKPTRAPAKLKKPANKNHDKDDDDEDDDSECE